MALSFELLGPLALDERIIEANILPLPGVYVLGEPHPQGGVAVRYAGRSDDNLARRLKEHQVLFYSHFVYMYASSANEAYLMECALYHEWPQDLKGQIHPARPVGSYTRCPRCG